MNRRGYKRGEGEEMEGWVKGIVCVWGGGGQVKTTEMFVSCSTLTDSMIVLMINKWHYSMRAFTVEPTKALQR